MWRNGNASRVQWYKGNNNESDAWTILLPFAVWVFLGYLAVAYMSH